MQLLTFNRPLYGLIISPKASRNSKYYNSYDLESGQKFGNGEEFNSALHKTLKLAKKSDNSRKCIILKCFPSCCSAKGHTTCKAYRRKALGVISILILIALFG